MRKIESYELEYPGDNDAEERGTKKKKRSPLKFSLYDFIDTVIFALVVITVVFTLFVRVFAVDGSSMNPTLHDGDKVLRRYTSR